MADRKGVSELGPPDIFVGDGVNPKAAAYAAQAARRAANRRGVPKVGADLGGPDVAIPRLDRPHQPGQTMADQALVGAPTSHELLRGQQGSIVEPTVGGGYNRIAEPADITKYIRMDDMLPAQAQADPQFRSGTGSMYASSQPNLAKKYGVVRGGTHIPPQQLVAGEAREGALRSETVRGLAALSEIQKQHQEGLPGMPQTDEEAVKDLGVAAHSSRAGIPVKDEQDLTEEQREEAREAIRSLDSFDYEKLRDLMNRDVLNNPDQQELVESRLKPLDIEELILRNSVSQEVPIIPGKFSVTFESMSGEDDIKLKELIMKESDAVEVTDRYLLDKFAFMSIACGIKAINKHPAPSHKDENGNFSEERFWAKFNWVLRRNIHMLASIGVNHTWFEMRVRKLFVAKK